MFPVAGLRSTFELGSELREAMAFLDQLFFVVLAREIEAAIQDERRDRVQFARIKEGPVAATDVDHGTRHTAEIHAVHHLPADDARTVMNRRTGRGRLPRPLSFEHRGLRFTTGANPLEVGGADPQAVACQALEHLCITQRDFRELTAAPGADAR